MSETPGTVRQWFRQMRAADFERDLFREVARWGVGGVDVLHGDSAEADGRLQRTLFDTLKLVEDVTRATYARRVMIGEFHGMPIFADESVPKDDVRLERSPHLMFSSAVPTGEGRPITFDCIFQWAYFGPPSLERHAPLYSARSVTGGLGGPFKVTGGPFASEQIMGWHITDGRGFTVAISCDAEFVKRVLTLRGDPE